MRLDDHTYAGFTRMMHELAGLHFNDSKKALVASRLAPRIQRLGLGGYEDYLGLLQEGGQDDELQTAIDLLTTNETYFFREQAHFDLLEQHLIKSRPKHAAVWSAASSFGDEAYSVAMVLADLQRTGALGDGWSVLGTDISDRVLRSAMQAIYPVERLREVSQQRLKRYCLRGDGEFEGRVQIGPQLTGHVRFGQLNLCEPIDVPGPFDVIFLRNVLIYFDVPTKIKVVDEVLRHLKPGGLFFLGTAEGRVACRTPLTTLMPGAFQKTDA